MFGVLTKIIQKKITDNIHVQGLHKPVFYRIYNSADNEALTDLLNENAGIVVYDTIKSQLRELIKTKFPSHSLTPEQYEQKISVHLNGTPLEEYGVWVYYPWNQKLVHILDEAEFIDLRTSANRNKITTAERDILAAKKVGVIGLSVGQSVSLTLALERGCGELRIADFDTLELNNLNRIRTGLHNLGLLKAYAVAREIAEIDPFFKVVCYTDGITEDNIHDFFTDGGLLNMVIDECDGVNIKILCRLKARELNVPVLMEASDRGTVDVERFDLEPDRKILHGWLEHLPIDFKILNNLKTSEEKLPYILPISGLETLSARMKASMVEIQQTITTWPQLATAVTLGGAVTADTCRRIFLNQFTDSGRYFIDMEKIMPDTRPKEQSPLLFTSSAHELTKDELDNIVSQCTIKYSAHSNAPGLDTIGELVKAAIKAPSAGNNQPWNWHYENNLLFLLHDRVRSVSFGDFQHIASYIALGAALENLNLAAVHHNISTSVHYFPVSDTRCAAVIQFAPQHNEASIFEPQKLYAAIDTRITNRNLGARVPLLPSQSALLSQAVASVDGAALHLRQDSSDLEELKEIMSAAERLRMLHAEGHYEFYEKEIRWNDEHSRTTGDGIDIATVDISASDKVGLKLVKDPEVVKLLADWRGGKALEKIANKAVNSASAVGLITMPQFTSVNYLDGGRAVERLWLTAADAGISMQPMLAATLHFARLKYGNGEGLPDFMKEEFSVLHDRFLRIFPEVKGRAEVFLFRLSIAELPTVKSYRYPIEKVFKHS
jgi:molybdopterin/thiamine biosynthesis adenylyltransferase